ncbi:hypothetical protein L6452_22051 [Arctium lappa]|uniref:Uncharacterized protein n=1 Tax=Arctium lappa TaxID=4217 RepID=A0ACB9AYB7_ARCLA|nr:hypothetical protein L6452_22051 [Arctium lappa]
MAIQKLLENLKDPNQIMMVIRALHRGAAKLANDPNGHHVLQYCLLHFDSDFNQNVFHPNGHQHLSGRNHNLSSPFQYEQNPCTSAAVSRSSPPPSWPEEMGWVRTKTVKKSSRLIIERYYKMTLDFHTNKKILEEVAIIPSKHLRNKMNGLK